MRSACGREPRRCCASSTTTAPAPTWGRAAPSPRPAPRKADRPGALGKLMYGVSKGRDLGWGSVEVLAAIAAGALLLVAMAAVELRTAEPIVALRLLGN